MTLKMGIDNFSPWFHRQYFILLPDKSAYLSCFNQKQSQCRCFNSRLAPVANVFLLLLYVTFLLFSIKIPYSVCVSFLKILFIYLFIFNVHSVLEMPVFVRPKPGLI